MTLYKSEKGIYRSFVHVGQEAALSAHPVLIYMNGCMTKFWPSAELSELLSSKETRACHSGGIQFSFLCSSLSIGGPHILLGETTEIREEIPDRQLE
jgi:hypothetical protein